MDEKQLEQLSSSSGIPLELLSRSIQARAESSGVTPADILNSWSGGEAIDPIPASKEEVNVVEEATNEIPDNTNNADETTEEQLEETVFEESVNQEIASSVAVMLEDIPPPVTISQKIIKSLRYGLSFGVVAGFIQGLVASSYLYDGLILEAETQNLIAEYSPISFVAIVSLSTAFFSILNSLNLKKILDSNFEGFGVLTTDRESIYTGAGLGLVFGSSIAFYVINSIGQRIEGILPEDPVINLISVSGALWRIVILSAIIQALVSIISMLLGVPKGLEKYEDLEANKIRSRIVGSIVIPLGSIVVGGIIAVAIAQIFLNFHEYAPLFALIISAAILLFASVMSSAPKIKITRSEVLIASAGVLTLIIIIASVAASQH
ncbi:MAG: hypothetical protein ACJ0GE_01465 [Candidatus Actinomarina sp.]|tara:strand:+ start:395 stop:1528 length:1134 start_codon:yes stop_codon:yes gene_type:complete